MLIPNKNLYMNKKYKRKYAINFDLKIEKLEKYYSETNPKVAYKEITKYMLNNGFIHRQYSGYISKNTMTLGDLHEFTIKLYLQFPWFEKCVRKLDATIISNIFDLKEIMENDIYQELNNIPMDYSENITLDK